MAKLHRFNIPKAKLLELTQREQAIIIGGGKVLNELNLTTKLMQNSINTLHLAQDDPTRTAALTTTMFFARILSGYVFEANKFRRKIVHVDELSNVANILDAEFLHQVRELDDYFQPNTNMIQKMRNGFSFHTQSELLIKSLSSISNEFSYDAYLGEYVGHNLFFGSEMIVIEGVQHLSPNTDWKAAINKLFVETTMISLLMQKVFQRVIGAIFAERLGLTMECAEIVQAADGPCSDDVVVPFFSLPPKDRQRKPNPLVANKGLSGQT